MGNDQAQHLELVSNLAERLNRAPFNMGLPVPKPVIMGSRIMNLRDPTTKMSKSDIRNQEGVVYIHDDPDTVVRKLRKAMTSTEFNLDNSTPSVSNLLNIGAGLLDCGTDDFARSISHVSSFSQLKDSIADLIIAHFANVRRDFATYQDRIHETRLLIAEAESQARDLAAFNLDSFYKAFRFTI